MKINRFLKTSIFFFFAILLLHGCRAENIIDNNANNPKTDTYKVVNKKEIPFVINYLTANTDKLKVKLNKVLSQNKTETIFGTVDIDNIVEVEKDGQTSYVFRIIPNNNVFIGFYNLKLQMGEDNNVERTKIIEYSPATSWILKGKETFDDFTGKIIQYNFVGDLESVTSYILGKGGCGNDGSGDNGDNGGGGGGDASGNGGPVLGNPGGWDGSGGFGVGAGSGVGDIGSGGEGEGEGEGEGGGGGNPCVNAVAGWSWVACVEGEDCIMKCVYSDTKYFRVGINPCPEDPDVVVTPAFTNTNYISNILFSYGVPILYSEAAYLQTHDAIAQYLKNLLANNLTQENANFIAWAVKFFTQNPNTTIEQFQKWFMNINVDTEFSNNLLKQIVESNYKIENFTINDYPGKIDGMPFEWWNNETWMKDNIRVDPKKPNEQPNAKEILLFMIYKKEAILHVKNSKNALTRAEELVQNNTFTHIHNGKADAFRHSFWNALDASDFGKNITLQFTTAHEWNSSNHPLETKMDLNNNLQGATIGENFNIFTSSSVIETTIIDKMKNTNGIWYLTPLANNDGDNILTTTVIKPTNQ